MKMIMNLILYKIVLPMVGSVAFVTYLLLLVGVPCAMMFGTAYLIDNSDGSWWFMFAFFVFLIIWIQLFQWIADKALGN